MTRDDDRERILARRAKFVAAAVAALGGAARKPHPPEPCLSMQACLSIAPEPEPEPCLSMQMNEDAGPEPEPQPCLSQPQPPPQVCLSVQPEPEPETPPGPFADPPPGKS